MQVGLSNYPFGNSNVAERADNKKTEKKTRKKFAPQNHYEKRKYLREQFEEKQARKALIRGQLGEGPEKKEIYGSLQGKGAFSRAIARYEANILKANRGG